jgi:hypothetical protein
MTRKTIIGPTARIAAPSAASPLRPVSTAARAATVLVLGHDLGRTETTSTPKPAIIHCTSMINC